MQKRLALTIMLAVSVAFLVCFFAFQPCKDHDERPLFRVYADPNLTEEVSAHLSWKHIKLGINNKTIYVLNCGSNPIRLALLVLPLPKGWDLSWDYNGSWILPGQVKRITLTLHVTDLQGIKKLNMAVALIVQEIKPIKLEN